MEIIGLLEIGCHSNLLHIITRESNGREPAAFVTL